jgi:dihydrofolate reductase
MKNFIYIAQSLDGYIAGPHGELDWLEKIDNPDKSDFGFYEFMKKVDALVMGKYTFEKVLTFEIWPYEIPVFVASNTLTEVPAAVEGKATLIKGNPKEIVFKLHKMKFNNLYIDGGALIQSFLKENMIQELIITTVPILLGGGIPLFGSFHEYIDLKLIKIEVLADQLVKTHYRVLN